MEDTSQLDPSNLQSLFGGSQPSLIPDSLVTTLTVGFIVLNVLTVLFFVFYVANMIRKWRVDTAILNMHKDLADIKAQLATERPTPAQPTPPAVQPAEQNRVIASDTTNHNDSPTVS